MAPIPEMDTIWMDGALVPWADAKVHVLTHALHYGSGVFEGIRAYKTERGVGVLRLTEHLKRLERSAKLYYMPVPYTVEQLYDATFEMLERNKLDAGYIRPLIFRGYGEMGLFPMDAPVQVIIAAWPWGSYLGEEGVLHRRARQDPAASSRSTTRRWPAPPRPRASTSTAFSPRSRCSTRATTRPSCSPSMAMWRRARAASSACATAC